MSVITPSVAFTDRACAGSRSRVRGATIFLAVTFTLVWAFSLSRSLFDPIGYDQGLYQYITDRVLAGQRMYVEVWDQNTPGIIGVHWLSTRLIGRSPLALRLFDACWQLLTLAALVALGGRDRRQWSVGWLAATLYALAYYGMGYVHTAQREGFIVLPLLLAAHAVVPGGFTAARKWATFAAHCLAGVMGLLAFAVKPPMGLCFGILWLRAVLHGWRARREGLRAWAGAAGMTAGFVAAAAASVALLVHLGWWGGCWAVLTRADMPGYIAGPGLVRDIIGPFLLGATVLAAALALIVKTAFAAGESSAAPQHQVPQVLRAWVVGSIVLGLLITNHYWAGWRSLNTALIGLWLPAMGSLLVRFWSGRSTIWRVSLLMLLASWVAMVLQGKFFLYHCPPLFAFAGYLTANELADRFRRPVWQHRSAAVWTAVCLAATVHLATGYWWGKMTQQGSSPWVLAGTTLEEHYTRVTARKSRLPDYATVQEVARQVRVLTGQDDPIAVLFHEPRLYYFAQRPPVHRLIPMQPIFRHMFEDFFQGIDVKRPKILLAHVPDAVQPARDPSLVQPAVFDDLESYFGPSARLIRQNYRVTSVVNDVCILQPNTVQP